MNPLRSLVNYFRPAKLRNKPNRLAYIRDISPAGAQLNGRIVTTVSADEFGMWLIDPPQDFNLSDYAATIHGKLLGPGDAAQALRVRDDRLEPLRDPGDEERDESLDYLPKVPALGKVVA